MSPSPPPQGRSAASLTGSFLLRPSPRPPRLASRSVFLLCSPLRRLPAPDVLYLERPSPRSSAPSCLPLILQFSAQEKCRRLLQKAPSDSQAGPGPPLGSPSQPCPLKSGHSVGTDLCPHHWTVSPERAGPGLSQSLLHPQHRARHRGLDF